ncbi:uncharacterized protein LOC125369505 [Ricinus communis]|uniref:uncharacterized protein LOC125369505 n=1 Tax=Ricinus communis TaxID=3988 RepID=UPI00201B2852|nr:uncharacterized protein LOC125369505 [Ricinus communis]
MAMTSAQTLVVVLAFACIMVSVPYGVAQQLPLPLPLPLPLNPITCLRSIAGVDGCIQTVIRIISQPNSGIRNLTVPCCNAINGLSGSCLGQLFPNNVGGNILRAICATIAALPPLPVGQVRP